MDSNMELIEQNAENACAWSRHYPTDKSNFRNMLKCEWLLWKLNKTPLWNVRKRNRIIKKLFAGIDGTAFEIQIPFHCSSGNHIYVGKNFFANFNCAILDRADVVIGDNVFLAPNVVITTIAHPLYADERAVKQMGHSFEPKGRGNVELTAPVTIGNNVWIAAGSIICPGVSIGDNAVIGAGSVVTHDIPSGVLAYGVPCRVVRKITESDKMENILL